MSSKSAAAMGAGRASAVRGELRVTATDLSSENIDGLRLCIEGTVMAVDLRTADVERLPFDDKSFDTTLCDHTLEHVRNFEKAVAELVRVTRRQLLVIVPCDAITATRSTIICISFRSRSN